jgi:magnesium-protoporphyrin O-methyltransferase
VLTSDAPVSGIRRTVRRGRADMAGILLSWLPADLSGHRVLDAGCGPGVLSRMLAERGAQVTGVDLSEDLVEVARDRCADLGDRVDFVAADLFEIEAYAGRGGGSGWDWMIAMDCFIHYPVDQTVEALAALSHHVRSGLLFTVAPATPLLSAMHGLGKLFPRRDRAPGIIPVGAGALDRGLRDTLGPTWHRGRSHRVHRGFYVSRAIEVRR